MKKILVGAPVRDREWILPRFIQHIKELDLTDIELSTMFIANDCSDNTVSLLTEAGMVVKEFNDLPTKTTGHVRGQYTFSHLANLRNILLEEFINTDNDYLLSIDTDILLPPDSLRKLVSLDHKICSMLLCNQSGRKGYVAHNIMREAGNGYMSHITKWEEDKVIEVDMTGAVYLIHRSVIESGVRYANVPQGEDIGFSRMAKSLGYTLHCDTSLRPIHVMSPGVELIGGCTE